ncbi:hypothetical protein BO99DRAFT_408065 [Aspergillus violaceofuscus CBS 115571]|uniref:Uncharacterized protein n=1 Tax=Aspergillus violaceofuscus (strain CBS 115571) TaxID=1450538 RepID=A0A2V5HJD8_ASPV1|nr:hypothetical protein BO99DRAFT_408065 [Aspergillus violaceofuscus CBS 115571]
MSSRSSEQVGGWDLSQFDEAAPVCVDGAASVLDTDSGVDCDAQGDDGRGEGHDHDLTDGQDDGPKDEPSDESSDDRNEDQADAQTDDHDNEPTDDAQTETTDTPTEDAHSDQPASTATHDDDFLHEVAQWHAYFQHEWHTHGGILRWMTNRALPAAGALALSMLRTTPAMYALHATHISSYLTTRDDDDDDAAAWPLRFRFTDQLTEMEWMAALLIVLVLWHQHLFKLILHGYRTTRSGATLCLDVLGLLSCVFCMPGLNGWVVGQIYGLTFAIMHIHLLCLFALYDTAVWARECARGLRGQDDIVVDVVWDGEGDDDDEDEDDEDEDARRDLAMLLDFCLMP